jgi:dTMP kinase
MTRKSERGKFITFEGVEGCGKSTQLPLLQTHLESLGYAVLVTREPGGTPIAEAIRSVLLNPDNAAMAPITELLLYEAARAQHVAERIRPALDSDRIVLCDRFADSTRAYQCGGRGLPREAVGYINEIATGGLRPDLTLVIDVPAEIGLARAARSRPSDRIEREAISFHERVRAEFLKLAQEESDRVKVVDGEQTVDEVAARIRALAGVLLEAS